MKKSNYFLLFALFFNSIHSQAQVSFSATPTLIEAVKPSNYFVFYNYSQFENLSGDTLQMRWVRTELTTSLGGSELGDWTLALNDPQNAFLNGIPDSADFVLLPVSTSTDKFIYQMFPNDQAGSILTRFRIFPIDNPADSVTLTFDYTSVDPVSSTNESNQIWSKNIYPNPVSDWLEINNPYGQKINGQLFTSDGRPIFDFEIDGNDKQSFDTSSLTDGVYFLSLEKEGNYHLKRLVVSH